MSLPLFDSLDGVASRIRAASHVLLCCDLDGGLAPVFDNPSSSSLSNEVVGPLTDLAASPQVTVAIVTGRAASDLRSRAAIPGLIVMSNHGLEIAGPDWSHIDPAVAESGPAVADLGKVLTKKLTPFPDVAVEERGLSLEVRYQQAPPEMHSAIRAAVHEVLGGSRHPFVLSEGMQSLDIRPRVYWHKGEAVLWLSSRVEHGEALVVFVGGDATDEDAFVVLPIGITVRVGTGGETAAAYHVDGPDGVTRFLEWLRDQIQQIGLESRPTA